MKNKEETHNEVCLLFGHLTTPDSDYCEECGEYTGINSLFEKYKNDDVDRAPGHAAAMKAWAKAKKILTNKQRKTNDG
ncbi:MAG: hypothetical protein H7831_14690 [Magnetococcus sp. WYHC-3]